MFRASLRVGSSSCSTAMRSALPGAQPLVVYPLTHLRTRTVNLSNVNQRSLPSMNVRFYAAPALTGRVLNQNVAFLLRYKKSIAVAVAVIGVVGFFGIKKVALFSSQVVMGLVCALFVYLIVRVYRKRIQKAPLKMILKELHNSRKELEKHIGHFTDPKPSVIQSSMYRGPAPYYQSRVIIRFPLGGTRGSSTVSARAVKQWVFKPDLLKHELEWVIDKLKIELSSIERGYNCRLDLIDRDCTQVPTHKSPALDPRIDPPDSIISRLRSQAKQTLSRGRSQ